MQICCVIAKTCSLPFLTDFFPETAGNIAVQCPTCRFASTQTENAIAALLTKFIAQAISLLKEIE